MPRPPDPPDMDHDNHVSISAQLWLDADGNMYLTPLHPDLREATIGVKAGTRAHRILSMAFIPVRAA